MTMTVRAGMAVGIEATVGSVDETAIINLSADFAGPLSATLDPADGFAPYGGHAGPEPPFVHLCGDFVRNVPMGGRLCGIYSRLRGTSGDRTRSCDAGGTERRAGVARWPRRNPGRDSAAGAGQPAGSGTDGAARADGRWRRYFHRHAPQGRSL